METKRQKLERLLQEGKIVRIPLLSWQWEPRWKWFRPPMWKIFMWAYKQVPNKNGRVYSREAVSDAIAAYQKDLSDLIKMSEQIHPTMRHIQEGFHWL